jgi:hypothetical protein
MLRKTHVCVAMLGCGVLALAYLSAGPTASADDKKDSKDKPVLSGAWLQKAGELKIEFSDKGVMKIDPHGNGVIVVVCEYSVEKEGRVRVKIADFEGKEEAIKKVKEREKLPIGVKFNFQWKVKDDTAKLDDLKGEGRKVDELKSHLEGEYEQKK